MHRSREKERKRLASVFSATAAVKNDADFVILLIKEMTKMKLHKLPIVLGMVLSFVLFFELAAHADPTDESTKITFNAPVQIPGRVLPAGSYWLQRADADNPDTIQIYSADHTLLYATLLTISTDRVQTAGETTITLAEPESGTAALVKWFYPGRTIGHEFVYPQQEEMQIAHATHETFVGDQSIANPEYSGE